MDSFWNGYVPCGGFDNTLQQPFALRDIFQHFAKLRLGFFLISEVVERNIAQTLSAATNLKSLYVTAGWDIDDLETCKPGRPTAFQEILGKCIFPQLTSLILSGFHSTSTELVRFIRGSSRLQHLTLAGHHLGRKGRWDSCANSIRIALPSLKHIVIDNVSFGANKFRSDGFEKFHKRRYSHRALQGFFFQGKTNPFTCAEPQDERVRVIFLARFDDADHFPGVHAGIDVCHASYLEFY